MNPRIDLLTKVIPLKLFLDMVPGSSAELTRTLRGCFRGGFVYVCFLSVSKRRKPSRAVRVSSLIILITTKEASGLAILKTLAGV